MATISKFYLLDAASPNTGTLPGAGDIFLGGSGSADTDGDALGARTCRDATDVKGTSNPDIESTLTSAANVVQQNWGHRRFASRPLAAHTFAAADGNWTFSYARSESNLNHNQAVILTAYVWRPGTGARVGGISSEVQITGTEPAAAATEEIQSVTGAWQTSTTCIDGDILVFEVWTQFTQAMATAYTEQFAYNGVTELSATTCATYVTPPAALTLYSAVPAGKVPSIISAGMSYV